MDKEELQDFKDQLESTTYLCDIVSSTDVEYLMEDNEYDDVSDLKQDILEHYILTYEVIYYSNAIEFLQREDPSLGESMEIASEMCITTDCLNSELLATLLFQRKAETELYEITI